MALLDLFYFENPEVVAFAIGALAFIISFAALSRILNNRASSIIISFVIGILASWYIFSNDFYNAEVILAVLFAIAVIGVIFRILMPFAKGIKKNFEG